MTPTSGVSRAAVTNTLSHFKHLVYHVLSPVDFSIPKGGEAIRIDQRTAGQRRYGFWRESWRIRLRNAYCARWGGCSNSGYLWKWYSRADGRIRSVTPSFVRSNHTVPNLHLRRRRIISLRRESVPVFYLFAVETKNQLSEPRSLFGQIWSSPQLIALRESSQMIK